MDEKRQPSVEREKRWKWCMVQKPRGDNAFRENIFETREVQRPIYTSSPAPPASSNDDGPRDAGCRSRSPPPRRGSTRTFWSERYWAESEGEEEERGVAAAAARAHSLARSLFGRFILLCHYSSCGRCGEETGGKRKETWRGSGYPCVT